MQGRGVIHDYQGSGHGGRQMIVSSEHAERIALGMLESIAPDVRFGISVAVSKDFDPEMIGA